MKNTILSKLWTRNTQTKLTDDDMISPQHLVAKYEMLNRLNKFRVIERIDVLLQQQITEAIGEINLNE